MSLLKSVFFTGLALLWTSTSVNSLSCVSMNNQECKVRLQIVYVNSNEPLLFPFSIKASKCSGSCNNVNDPHAKICVPDIVKNLNIKVFNLMSRTNETRHIQWYESVFNNKKPWDDDKCRCECKKLIYKGVFGKGFIWNLSNCECECDKSCDVGEYLDYENCKCRKKIVDIS